MIMIEDLEKSMKATLYDRLTSPLIGSYITAWCLCNYKVFLIIFSELTYQDKIAAIDKLFCGWQVYCWRYGVPLLWAAFYILIYPVIAKFVFERWQCYIKEKEDIKHKVRSEECLTIEQSQKLKQEIADKSIEFERLTSDKTATIKTLTEEKSFLQEENKKLQERVRILEERQNASNIREKLIADHDLKYDSTGILSSQKNTSIYFMKEICPKCFNDDSPKLLVLDSRRRCPSCGGNYPRNDVKDKPIGWSPDFGCWLQCQRSGQQYICPSCFMKYHDYDYARLVKISEDSLYCPLCKSTYPRLKEKKDMGVAAGGKE